MTPEEGIRTATHYLEQNQPGRALLLADYIFSTLPEEVRVWHERPSDIVERLCSGLPKQTKAWYRTQRIAILDVLTAFQKELAAK